VTWNVVLKLVGQRSHGISRRRGQVDIVMYKNIHVEWAIVAWFRVGQAADQSPPVVKTTTDV